MVSGSGTSGDPFILTSFSDLELIGSNSTYSLAKYYKLGANIDASATADPGYNSGAGWQPRGDSTTPFTGKFDGNGYAIEGLYINRPTTDNVGLFGVGNNGTLLVTNLTLNKKNGVGGITGQNYVGGILGTAPTNVVISYCTVNIPVTGNNYVGGVFGGSNVAAYCSVNHCNCTGVITGVNDVGGIVGLGLMSTTGSNINYNTFTGEIVATGSRIGGILGQSRRDVLYNTVKCTFTLASTCDSVGGIVGFLPTLTTITGCKVYANITARDYLGGIVGGGATAVSVMYLTECLFVGAISGRDNVGGLVGNTQLGATGAVVQRCFSSGSVTGTGTYAGGLIGYSSLNITDCYSVSSVSGGSNVGGLVGYAYNKALTRCYSKGAVSGSSSVGGLVGVKNVATAADCFWDTQTSGQSSSALGTGKTTAEMKTQSTFTNYDFSTVWIILEWNSGYPYLRGALPAQWLYPSSIGSGEAFGTPEITLEGGTQNIVPPGIGSEEAFGSPVVYLTMGIPGSVCVKPLMADFPGELSVIPLALWDLPGTLVVPVPFKRVEDLDIPGSVSVTSQPSTYIPGILLVGTDYTSILKLKGKILYDPLDEPDEPGLGDIIIGISVGGTNV